MNYIFHEIFVFRIQIKGQVWPPKVFLQILAIFSGFYNEIWYMCLWQLFATLACFWTVLPFLTASGILYVLANSRNFLHIQI